MGKRHGIGKEAARKRIERTESRLSAIHKAEKEHLR
jgi:hypothetical protein